MENGIRGGKKPPQEKHDDIDSRVEFNKLFFHEPPRTIEITEILAHEEITQNIVLSKISSFTTWESESNGYVYKHTYWLSIELVSGKEYKFNTYDKNKFDEWVGILKAGVR